MLYNAPPFIPSPRAMLILGSTVSVGVTVLVLAIMLRGNSRRLDELTGPRLDAVTHGWADELEQRRRAYLAEFAERH